MKKLLLPILIGVATIFTSCLLAFAAPITPITGGGTGTSTAPNNGFLLIGNASNTYSFIASSSLGSGGTGTVVWLANGTTFFTSSTVNFQAGTNVTITTSTNGTYTIAASGSGGGGFTNANASSGIAISTSTTVISIQNVGVVSTANNSASGGIDFSAATGTGITAVLHSLALSQFTGNIVNTFNTQTGATVYAVNCTSGCSVVSSTTSTAITVNFPAGLATTTITASGTATGNSFTFASSSGAADVRCSNSTCTFTIPTNTNQLTNGAGFISTSTGLSTANFTSANISQWTNNSGYITTSTGLTTANFASANISQWTNNSGYLANASVTANAPITWSAGNVIGCANCAVINADNNFSAGQTVVGNITSTNHTISSTLRFYQVQNGSTSNYTVTNDVNDELRFQNHGGTQGTGLDQYTLLSADAPVAPGNCNAQGDTTGNSQESTLSNFRNLGTSTGYQYVDYTLQCYPGGSHPSVAQVLRQSTVAVAGSGGIMLPTEFQYAYATSSAGILGSVRDWMYIVPVVATDTTQGFNIAINPGTSTSTPANFNVNGTSYFSGNVSIATSTQNGNLYIGCSGTCIQRISRGATNNFGLMVFATAGTDQWSFGMTNNSTNNFIVQDAVNGGFVINAAQNGVTTIGNSGSGVGITLGSAATASTTLTVNQTSSFKGNVSSTIVNALWLAGANGVVSAYGGSNCAAGSLQTGTSATGTAACTTTSTVLAGYSTSTGANRTATISSQTPTNGTANTFARSDSAVGFAATITIGNANATGTLSGSSTLNIAGATTLQATTTVGTAATNQFTVNPTTGKSYVQAGTSTIASTIGGTLAFSATSTGNGAGASTTIETYNIPTSTYLTVGDEVDIFLGGTLANSVNTNKQIQVSIASTTVFDTGAAFAPNGSACNWFAESRGMLTTATTTMWVTQFTDSCQNALTDNSGDAGNKSVTVTSTQPIAIRIYANGTGASDVVANYFRVLYAPF